MASREDILSLITKNKPYPTPLPVMDMLVVTDYTDNLAQFTKVVEGIGGKVEVLRSVGELKKIIETEKENNTYVIDAIYANLDEIEGIKKLTPFDLGPLHKSFIKGLYAIAENGSIWLTEVEMHNRLLPFICENLALVVGMENLLPTMHAAYEKVDTFSTGFGVFIAGPSKTADIEQSLVIGAHGPKALVVYFIEEGF